MSKRIYFDIKGDGGGRTLESWREIMEEEALDEIILCNGVYEEASDCFYCTEFDCIEDKYKQYCGTWCERYKPRNGKSGWCRFSRNTYDIDLNRKYILRKGKRLKRLL